MRVIVVGLGVQGTKRRKVAGRECVATVEIKDGLWRLFFHRGSSVRYF